MIAGNALNAIRRSNLVFTLHVHPPFATHRSEGRIIDIVLAATVLSLFIPILVLIHNMILSSHKRCLVNIRSSGRLRTYS
jgi:lipopolysaccharide/colanic/teichoic acid biosynthesis glycosyltransferase